MPEPQTLIDDFKIMYVCEKIFQKIKLRNRFDFDFDNSYNPEKPFSVNEISLNAEKDYITREIKSNSSLEESFRIENRKLPKYYKMEVWKNYAFLDSSLEIDSRDIFANNTRIRDQILSKVLKGIFGSNSVGM